MNKVLQIPTLGIHHISTSIEYYTSIQPSFFTELIQYLSTKYYFLSLTQILNAIQNDHKVPQNGLLLTFDDAYEDTYKYLISATLNYKIKGVIFVITDYIGKRNDWNSKSPYLAYHLTREQLQSLIKHGYELGSHTCSHHNLLKFNSLELDYQMRESKTILEQEYNTKVLAISYPYGFYNDKVKTQAAQYYNLGFSTQTKTTTMNWFSDFHSIRRIMITKNSTLSEIDFFVSQYRSDCSDFCKNKGVNNVI